MSFTVMKIYHCIPISDDIFQLELKAAEPWLILPGSIELQEILSSADI